MNGGKERGYWLPLSRQQKEGRGENFGVGENEGRECGVAK